MRRFLRPGFLAPVGERLWAVDEFQPVAAVLAPAEGAVERVVSWPELPAPPVTFAPWFEGWRVLGSSDGLWVQPYPGGPVAVIGDGGLRHASYSAGTRLQVVSAAGAWCAPRSPGQEFADAPGTPPRQPLKHTPLLLVRADGTSTTITIDRPVRELRLGAEGVYARLDVEPWTRRDLGDGNWVLAYDQTWILLPSEAGDESDTSVRVDEHPGAAPPELPAWRCNGFLGPGGPWHSARDSGARGPLSGGMRWALGWDRQRRGEQRAIATGHEPGSNAEQRRIDLGSGRVLAAAPAEHHLWLAIQRARWVSPYVGGPVELARIDTRDGRLEPLVPADSVEITHHCWPLSPTPVEPDSYAEHHRKSFEGLDAVRHPTDGYPPRSLVEGMHDCRTELLGSWPDTAIRVSFAHDRFPGLRLARRIPLFDELGRQRPPEHAAAHLMEDLDTGNLPSAGDAIDGELEV